MDKSTPIGQYVKGSVVAGEHYSAYVPRPLPLPTMLRTLDTLQNLGIIRETSGKERNGCLFTLHILIFSVAVPSFWRGKEGERKMVTASKPKKKATIKKPASKRARQGFWVIKDDRLFTLDVLIIDGPMTKKFLKKNKEVSRIIEMRGDQTLEELHHAIFTAFDRFDPHLYEFQIGGKGPMDPEAKRYVLQELLESDGMGREEDAFDLTTTTIGSLGLEVDDFFGYWFDFGDDWWHQINVISIGEKAEGKGYPKITGRTGDSPPQYVDWDEMDA